MAPGRPKELGGEGGTGSGGLARGSGPRIRARHGASLRGGGGVRQRTRRPELFSGVSRWLVSSGAAGSGRGRCRTPTNRGETATGVARLASGAYTRPLFGST